MTTDPQSNELPTHDVDEAVIDMPEASDPVTDTLVVSEDTPEPVVSPADDGDLGEIDMPQDVIDSIRDNSNRGKEGDVQGLAVIRSYPFQAYGEDEEVPIGKGVILLPSVRLRELFDRLQAAGVDLGQRVEKGNYTPYQRRLMAYFADLSSSTDNIYTDRTLDRTEARWTQGIEHEGRWLQPGRPRVKGSDPVLQIRTKLGIGGAFTYPLWHTGIWVTLRTPSQGSYFNLLRDIYMKKRELGRMSNGMVFSQTNAYTTDDVLEYIAENIIQTNYHSDAKEDLMAILDWRDIPWLVQAMAHTIYSNGYDFQQPCISTEGCEFVANGRINLGRTFWTDSNGFTPMQISHMANSRVQRTHDDILRYKAEFTYKCNRTVRLNDEISVRIGDATAERFRNSSNAWINEITASVKSLFSQTMTLEQRQEHIASMATLDTVRQYAHFFEAVIITDGDESAEAPIETAEDVDNLIRTIQEDVVSTDALYKALENYWRESIRAFVGIPKYICPTCKKVPEIVPGAHRNEELIPLEPIRVFFTLLAQHRESRLLMEQFRN